MNIFYLNENPAEAAKLHCLRHTKMILESAQLLCSAHHVLAICKNNLIPDWFY